MEKKIENLTSVPELQLYKCFFPTFSLKKSSVLDENREVIVNENRKVYIFYKPISKIFNR